VKRQLQKSATSIGGEINAV